MEAHDPQRMNWKDFKNSVPELAREAQFVFEQNGLALVGTIRSDGSPRISPVEVFFLPDLLLFGMMRSSKKALDLIRDPRCVLHNTVSDPNGSEPEVKFYGRAIAQSSFSDYSTAYTKRWKRPPPESFPAHVFSIDIESAALIRYDTSKNQMITKQWSNKNGVLKEDKRNYP